MTSRDIEIAVAKHFNYRINLIVPNVYWGWNLRHEADLVIARPSGYCDEVEIKVSASDIKADTVKRYDHWENSRILRVWFAVPEELKDHPDIPEKAGILAVKMNVSEHRGISFKVTVHRPAAVRPKDKRRKITDKQRLKLAELAAMRVWALKERLG